MTQTEPKLFRTSKGGTNTTGWKLASAVLSVIALGAGGFGYAQYNTVITLEDRLAEATAQESQTAAADSQLRAQLSAAQDRINSQGAKLTVAAGQVDTEHQALADVQQQVAARQQQLAAAETQVQDEKRALQNARAALAAESRPDLPVRLSFFNAVRAGVKVAVLRNLSSAALDVTLDVHSPGSDAHLRKQLVLAANGMLRMGPAQGWSFTPGQVVTLDSAKFRRIVQKVS